MSKEEHRKKDRDRYRLKHNIPLDVPLYSVFNGKRSKRTWNLQRALEMRNKGYSFRRIAYLLGNVVSVNTIHVTLRQHLQSC